MMKFKVNRQHLGDRMYMPGDEREAAEAEVKHLIDAGVLEKAKSAKADQAPANKAEPAPENKSAGKKSD
jgi:hypothetical protein